MSENQNNTEAEVQSLGQLASTPKPNDVRRLQDGQNMAITLSEGGYEEQYIYKKLMKEGYSHEEARDILSRLRQNTYIQAQNQNKLKNDYRTYPQGQGDQGSQVMLGIAMIVIGLGITFCSYQMAANSPGGGTYIITWGLVISGALRVLTALFRRD
jgi:hypothetical protein